ncbi:MAG: fasciclin domain-containing protein [Natronosporangium sp.]
MMNRKLAGFAAAAVLALAVAGCGDDEGDPPPAADPAPTAAATDNMDDTAAQEQFGPGCAAVPTDPSDPGSFEAMAQVPVATAASGNPVLETLVTAVGEAGLGDSLNSAAALTVFAPTNDAFAAIPEEDLNAVLADQELLTSILTYHAVEGRLGPDELAGTHTTLAGSDLTVAGSGTDFTVNDAAAVVCGNVQTANATVYIIDAVLMP